VKALYQRAVARRHLNKLDGAREDLLHILDIEPENETSSKLLKEVEEALGKTRDESKVRPMKLPAIVNREEKRDIKKEEKVVATSNKEVILDPKTVPNKETASAESAMIENSIEEINHKKAAFEWKEQGNRHFDKREYGAAYDCYTKAINLDRSEAIYHANRAWVLVNLERFEEAEKDSNTAISLNPNHVKSYQRRAVAKMKLGKLLEAKDDLVTVEKLVPRNRMLPELKKELQQLWNLWNLKQWNLC
jgi:tetratricopeptide (TPR) repeat protein